MHFSKSLRRAALAAALLCAALSSTALTLGRSRGVALLGRPLDFTIAVTLDAATDEAGLCPEADVFQGDTRVDAGRVAVRLERGTGREALLRVRSAALVDEPVVTVYLRLGCQQKVTRRYVLLAELSGDFAVQPADVNPAAAPVLLPRPSAGANSADPASVQGPSPRPAGARTASARRAAAAATAGEAAAAPVKPAETRPRAQPRPRRAAEREKPADGGRSRLEVSMLDLMPEGEAKLKSSDSLPGAPTATPQQRAEAAALWRAIQAGPADVLRDAQRLQAMENDVKGLRDLVKDTNKSLAELRVDLDKARNERTIAFGAFAVVLLLIAAGVLAWRLRRSSGTRGPYRDWWRRQDNFTGDTGLGEDSGLHHSRPSSRSPVDVDLGVDESMFESLRQAPARPLPSEAEAHDSMRSDHSGFAHSVPSGLRMVKAEELVDIQHQAEFFMSLGQVDQAIEVLQSHIHNNVE
ncbi:MAG: hypothetical protein ABI907_12690, partial [Ramlibacter sp.]